MTITADQARRLLDDAEHTGRWEANYDDESDATRLYHDDEDVEITDGGSWALAAAAPDLAHTVIAQASMIGKLYTALRQRDQVIEDYRAEWGDL